MPAVQRPFFVVFSLSRCGSTTLFRALEAHRDVHAVYEPYFLVDSADQLRAQLVELTEAHSGMKHVWDPSGFPYRKDHRSEIADIESNIEKWMTFNEAILTTPGLRLILLIRADERRRILSDLLGQATEVWGPRAHAKPSAADQQQYEKQVLNHDTVAIDAELMAWYVDNVPRLNDRLRTMAEAGGNPVMEVTYEQLFGPDLSVPERVAEFNKVVEFLSEGMELGRPNRRSIRKALDPGARLNNAKTYSRVRNLSELEARFGPLVG